MDDSGRPHRVAIAHDWLTIPGGSEKVVARMLRMFPQAEIFTSVYDPAPWPPVITSRPVHTSFLNRIPGATRNYPRMLPLMNAAFESFDFTGFDLVLSSSHACARAVRVGPHVAHVSYTHAPMRYAWEFDLEKDRFPSWTHPIVRPMMAAFRRWDRRNAQRVDVLCANSRDIAGRMAARTARGAANAVAGQARSARYEREVGRSAHDVCSQRACAELRHKSVTTDGSSGHRVMLTITQVAVA